MFVMNSITGPDLCHCLAARRNARYLTRLYDRHLTSANLSASQFSLLAMLAEYPGISISALAEAMVMERTTLIRALKPLQSEGFIGSHTEGPRSALRFFLSPAGEAKLNEAEPYWQKAQQEFETRMGQEQAAAIRASLLSGRL
ncbi:MarR family winged helix-turn-helix transcriptional regulator [Xanthomonas hortorum pv. vitians]|uniref:MarR family winged helix-turn-helix transcriptional regulator n=3 Tax=Xanthomonas hortorum TaxID=56454 RepID=A0AAW8ZKY3_9XANT|nr:MarR family winged helix-turn-helix transcriptional regulator [Xanthomonas hortorum pv. vitians]